MGIRVTIDDALKGVKFEDKTKMFPGFTPSSPDTFKNLNLVTVAPPGDQCARKVVVTYDTNFAVSASNVSKREKFLDLVKGLVSLVEDTPSANAVINGVNLLGKAIDTAIDTKRAQSTQEFTLNPTPCKEATRTTGSGPRSEDIARPPDQGDIARPPDQDECYTVTLQVIGSALMLDVESAFFGGPDKAENVEITLTLSAFGLPPKSQTFPHPKLTDKLMSITPSISVGPVKTRQQFDIYAKLDEFCSTDGKSFGGDSVSIIKIDAVKIVIETVPCEE